MIAYAFPPEVVQLATTLLADARRRGLTLATAESCTGGLVAAALTEIAGSSDCVQAGFVTYADAAKQALLGVPAALLEARGAVSPEVAAAMAHGALERTGADVAVSITGVAGPGGGSAGKPVGLVQFACARRDATVVLREERFGDLGRNGVRNAALLTALLMLHDRVLEVQPGGGAP